MCVSSVTITCGGEGGAIMCVCKVGMWSYKMCVRVGVGEGKGENISHSSLYSGKVFIYELMYESRKSDEVDTAFRRGRGAVGDGFLWCPMIWTGENGGESGEKVGEGVGVIEEGLR